MKKYQRIVVAACVVLFFLSLLMISGWIDAPFGHLISHIFKKPVQNRWASNLHRIGFILGLVSLLTAGFTRYRASNPSGVIKWIIEKEQGLSAGVQASLQSILLPAQTDSTQPGTPGRRVNWVDIAIGTGFLIFSLLFFLGRLQGNYPTVILGGDGGNIASFATAWDHPELFKGDELLGDLNNIRIYSTIHIPLIRALHPLTGDYGLAYLLLLAPHIFLHLLGFYIFGRVLFKNRFWALLLAIIITMPISINLGELWGISRDPLPRFTYQTILPYVLSLTLIWKDQPKRWPWLMVACGLLFYAHPVSAPIFGFAIWAGLWLVHPKAWSIKKRFLVMFGLGLLFVLAASPFAINYFSFHVQGSSQNYDEIISIIKNFFPKNLLDVPAALSDFGKIITKNGLLPLSILGLILLWVLRKPDRTKLKIVIIWTAGLICIVILVPYVEQIIERYFKLLPLETELLRGIRYLVPIMLILCIWPLSELNQRLKNRTAALVFAAAGLLFTGLWVNSYQPDFDKIGQAIGCLEQGKLVCITNDEQTNLMQAIIKDVPPGAPIFAYTSGGPSLSYSLEIRYVTERPLVYTFKDRGLLGYANHTELLNWLATNQTLQSIEEKNDKPDRVEPLVWFARGLNAQYLLLDFPASQDRLDRLHLTAVYRDSVSTLIYLGTGKPPQ